MVTAASCEHLVSVTCHEVKYYTDVTDASLIQTKSASHDMCKLRHEFASLTVHNETNNKLTKHNICNITFVLLMYNFI